ncbi:TetR/AcrR family transcriptional regulator [Microbacterium sp.]|uniref:TetR/AcrR family transcriptional regulator n=1 Tax=Microbacterium sp. TaxID=51671 RepID=UPI003A89CF93
MSDPPLSRDAIVDAALALTRADGLSAVTMRAVASRMHVTPMALYHHVGDRDGLVRLVADRVGSFIHPETDCVRDWQDRVRAWAGAQYATLREYPGVAAWLMDNGPAGPEAYRLLETLTGTLTDAGFSDSAVARIATLVMSWTFSRIAIEDNAAARERGPRRGRARAFVAGLTDIDPTTHPNAARVGVEFFTLPLRETFDGGIETILAGSIALHPSAHPVH